MSNIQNYFMLFELPVKLPVDRNTLTVHYQQLQRQYHPDNFATANDAKRLEMLQYSANINQAYQTLKDPIHSAEYLLSLHGIVVDPEQNIINDNHFLMEQFELREQLDTIENIEDHDRKECTLSQFAAEIKKRWQESNQTLLLSIEQSDWSLALSQINKLRFLEKLQQDIERLEEKLFDF